MTGSAPVPVPITSRRHFHGICSSTDSGVCPKVSRNFLEAFFLRLRTVPRSITTSCSCVTPSMRIEPNENFSKRMGTSGDHGSRAGCRTEGRSTHELWGLILGVGGRMLFGTERRHILMAPQPVRQPEVAQPAPQLDGAQPALQPPPQAPPQPAAAAAPAAPPVQLPPDVGDLSAEAIAPLIARLR